MKKAEWQRADRQAFAMANGYSRTAHYSCGGKRADVLRRDRSRCVRCGMTDAEHKSRWGRPITVDHKNKDRSDNSLRNLQVLCLSCHGRKDLLPRLRTRRVETRKVEVLARRDAGETYQQIADALGFSIGAIWKWTTLWSKA